MSDQNQSITYKPRGQKVYVLTFECQVVGVWSNLKYLCRDRSDIEPFPSYSKLSKDIAELRQNGDESPVLPIKTKDGKAYEIKVEVLK